MPGKVNPVLAEMLDMAMFHVLGNDLTVTLAAQAGQLELNVMMPIIAHDLFEMMQVVIGSVNAFTDYCVIGLKANAEKATGWLAKNAILVTALNPADRLLEGRGDCESGDGAQHHHPRSVPGEDRGRRVGQQRHGASR